jgi:hypothetical protein
MMPKKPKDTMLPGVRGVTVDIDDRDNPQVCLVGLLTEEGTKSFTLSEHGARMMVTALHSFIDLFDVPAIVTKPKGPAN